MTKRYFPIKTATSCHLKWNWSTLYLNSGATASCHRTGHSNLTQENFKDFHNTDVKIQDRKDMLAGQWPESNCSYCKNIEDQGGVSDRIRQLDMLETAPPELENDLTATHVTPQIVEVYFNNYCNLGCLYCTSHLSSSIEAENKHYGDFINDDVKLINFKRQAKDLIPAFWEWFKTDFKHLKQFHILGGEPLLQKEFDKFLELVNEYPNPQCEISAVTNLMIPEERLEKYISKIKRLIIERKIKRFDFTCSLDCWGPEQEYVRYGLDLELWQRNFERLLKEQWLTININQTISVLTVKTMPELLRKMQEWRKQHKIGHWFSGVEPEPNYMKLEIFGNLEFKDDVKEIAKILPQETEQDRLAFEYMKGIFAQAFNSKPEYKQINNLIIYLNEKDRRRNTNWRKLFPWLEKYENNKY